MRDPAIALAVVLAIAIACGGGGIDEPLANLTVQLSALALLAVHGFGPAGRLACKGPRALALLVVATLALPLLQLVPLPPPIWQALPGRALVREAFGLAGIERWAPVSVDGGRTLLAFVGLLAPLAVVVVGLGLTAERLGFAMRATIVAALASAAFGALHLIEPQWGDLYAAQRPMPGIMVATFADRNAAALFFVCALLLLVGLPEGPRGPLALASRMAAGLFLTVAVVLTQSRTGLVLLALPAGLLAWRLTPLAGMGNGGIVRILGAVLATAAAGALVLGSDRLQEGLARFGDGDGMRAEMREDALFAAQRYWPVGAGMGTFDEVFQVDESLEYVSPRKAGRAHMDYLELAIEAGLAGLAVLAGWFAWVGVAGWRAARTAFAWPARAAVLILLGIAAQSLLGFPLRNQAMLCVAALAVVLAARSPALVPRR